MISKLHYITQENPHFTHQQLITLACKGGANWVQLRVKNKSYTELLLIGIEAKAICKKYKTRLIINDNVTLAKELEADGVHLGKSDMCITDARKYLGSNFIIGGTANTFQDILQLTSMGVNYIGLGPYRFTKTKENLSPVIGLDGLNLLIKQCKLGNISTPIIAIGGIHLEDIQVLLKTGIYGVAIASAINEAEDKVQVVQEFVSASKID